MKKFIIALSALILLYLAYDTARYRLGWYIDLKPDEPVTAFMTTDTQSIYMDRGSGPEPFIVKGVNLGVGLPGEWATDYAIDRETYLRWFGQMQEMGANTVRVYITLHDDFYNAFYEYNTLREENGEEPLWLIHGVWVNDYVQNSHRDAYDKDFLDAFIEDGRTLVDVLHGNKKISLGRGTGSGFYNKDVSRWVIGYILGVEWEDVTVAYTDHKYPDLPPYQGTYLSATEDASAFESMLAQAGDRIIEYESRRYKSQRLVAFSNWPTTDPFLYPEDITTFFMKCAQVDVEHIRAEDAFLAGQFVSYHVYPYYPDYLNYSLNPAVMDRTPIWDGKAVISRVETGPGTPISELLRQEDFYDETGAANTYLAYLRALRRHHTMPVVISEFGVSTGRGMAQIGSEHLPQSGPYVRAGAGAGARGLLARHHRGKLRGRLRLYLAGRVVQAHLEHHARGESPAHAVLERLSDQRAVFRSALLRPRREGKRLLCGRRPLGVDGGG